MRLISQPFDGQLGEIIRENLGSGEFDQLNVVVAFAKNSGVLRLREAFEDFRANGGKINLYVGIDMNVTSYEALANLLPVSNALRVVHDENGQTFHTKLFNFVGQDRSVLIVGSNNLTGGGLWTSYESSIQLDLDLKNPKHAQMQGSVEKYLQTLSSLGQIVNLVEDKSFLEALLLNSYVEKEVKARVERRRTERSTNRRQTLFVVGERAKLPTLPQPPRVTPPSQKAATTPLSSFSGIEESEDPTLWLETRKMTGGSRNILDLSKTSLLRNGTVTGTPYAHEEPDFMRGAVEFFDVNPEDTSREKEIVVNFEGIDYWGNTIKFPTGKNANGTWRVQIKGVSTDGRKITSAFKEKAKGGYFLPEKIVTFTRVESDYFYMSVFSAAELPEFLTASTVVAYNGRTNKAKLLGIL